MKKSLSPSMRTGTMAAATDGYDSVMGCGRTVPDPKGDVEIGGGTVFSSGPGVQSPHRLSSLLHNEYPLLSLASYVYTEIRCGIDEYFYIFLINVKFSASFGF